MNILLVNSAAPELWGGGEKWFVEAARWFNAHGHQTALVCRPDSLLMQRAKELRLEIVASVFGGDFDPMAMLRAREILRASHADVVLTNFNKESWQFGIAGKSLRVPVVARHGYTLWSKKLHHKLLAKRVINKLIVNAESIREHYEALRLAPQEVVVIHNGVKPADQNIGALRKKLGLDASDLLLVAAGRLESQKRFDRLLDIAAELMKTTRFKLAIFGAGPFESSLRTQAAELKLNEHVAFFGFDPNFASLVGDADLFLLTSDDEGTPNVVLEAMSAGVPVLGFKVGSMKEILSGELSEFLIDAGDSLTFQETLQSLVMNRESLLAWREKFRDRVNAKFSFDHSMNRYVEVLQEVTTRK